MSLRLASALANDPDMMKAAEIVAAPLAVAGLVTLASLPPKGGKTTTVCGLAAEASRNGVPIAVLTLDEPIAVTLQRLERFGADLELVWLDDRLDAEALQAELAAAGVRVLAVDHIGKLAELSPDFGANSQGDSILWGRLLSPFTTLARETGLAVVLLAQSRRSDSRYAGSYAIAATVDLLCEMAEKDGGLVCTPRGRVSLPAFRVELDAEGVPQFLSDASVEAPRAPRSEQNVRADQLLELLRILVDAEPEGLRCNAWERIAKDSLGMSRRQFFRGKRAHHDAGRIHILGKLYRVTRSGEVWAGSVPTVPTGANGTTGTPLNGANGATTRKCGHHGTNGRAEVGVEFGDAWEPEVPAA